MRQRYFDGMMCGNGTHDGLTYEVFDAPWWKFWRWVDWYFLSGNRAKGTITLTDYGQPFELRVRVVNLGRAAQPVVIRPRARR